MFGIGDGEEISLGILAWEYSSGPGGEDETYCNSDGR